MNIFSKKMSHDGIGMEYEFLEKNWTIDPEGDPNFDNAMLDKFRSIFVNYCCYTNKNNAKAHLTIKGGGTRWFNETTTDPLKKKVLALVRDFLKDELTLNYNL